MGYALIIRVQDGRTLIAARRISYTTRDSPSKHMRYDHPSAARRAYGAFEKKFADYVGLRPVSGHIVKWSDLPAVLTGKQQLPPP